MIKPCEGESRRPVWSFRALVGLPIAALLALAASAAAQDTSELSAEVLESFRSGARFAIPGLIAGPGGEAETVSRYLDVERALYWETKDLEAAMYVAEQGIAYCLARAAQVAQDNPTLARQLRSAAGRIAFNLASSTWPGWDEPGIDISSDQLELGRQSAALALGISEQLEAAPAALANGNWMVGAHHLAGSRFGDAIQSFEAASLLARASGDRGMELTSQGFAALAEIAGEGDRQDASEQFDEVRRALELEVQNAAFWTTQLDVAYEVFVGNRPDH